MRALVEGADMKISYAILGAAALALSACGGKGDDTAGDNVEQAYDNAADNMDAMADNTTNATAGEMMEEKADATREMGKAKEEAMDDADMNATK